MRKSLQIKVFGKVQGVFFRIQTKRKADELGILGSVMNMNDGSVFIEASGEENSLRELLEWSHGGPAGARVERVEFDWVENKKTFDKFIIV